MKKRPLKKEIYTLPNAMEQSVMPMLASGVGSMFRVESLWASTTIVAGISALFVFLGIGPGADRKARALTVVSLAVSCVPFLVLLINAESIISSYASARVPFYLISSSIPLILSGISVWRVRKGPPPAS